MNLKSIQQDSIEQDFQDAWKKTLEPKYSIDFSKQANLTMITLFQGITLQILLTSSIGNKILQGGIELDSSTLLFTATLMTIFSIYWQGIFAVRLFRWPLDFVHQLIYFLLAIVQSAMALNSQNPMHWCIAGSLTAMIGGLAILFNVFDREVLTGYNKDYKAKLRRNSINEAIMVFFYSLMFIGLSILAANNINDQSIKLIIGSIGLIAAILNLLLAYKNYRSEKAILDEEYKKSKIIIHQ